MAALTPPQASFPPAGVQGPCPPHPGGPHSPGPPGRAVRGGGRPAPQAGTTGHGPCLGSAATKQLLAARRLHEESAPPNLLPSAQRPLALTLSPLPHAPRAKAPRSFWVTFHSRLSPGEAERESGFLEGLEKAPWRGLGPRSESGSVV